MAAAHDEGQFVQVRCDLCGRRHVFLPADLLTLSGNLKARELQSRLKCERCRRVGYCRVTLWHPTAIERQKMVVRRLVGIRRVPIWRDEGG